MKYIFPKGSTSVIVPVFIQDSSSTTGAGLGSLDQTSSIVGGYVRPGGTGVALAVDENVTTEGTYEAPSAASKVRIGTPANMRTGTYELHLHNDLLAAGADAVLITLGGATNMADLVIEIQLTDVNLNDSVRGGMTALPNAAADAAGGVPISDAGGLDLDTKLANTNEITVARMGALTDWIDGGRLDLLLDAILEDTGTTIPGLIAALNNLSQAEANAACDTALSDYDAPTKAEMDTAHALLATLAEQAKIPKSDGAVSWNTAALAAINDQVVDVLETDTHSELAQGAPAAAPPLLTMIQYLYQYFRMKLVQDATTLEMYNDAGDTVIAKATLSDAAGDFTKGEMVSGP